MKHPADWINRLLESICDPRLLESIQGDLQELYEDRLEQYGLWRARFCYFFDALGFLRPFAWKKKNTNPVNHFGMLRNHLTIALRNLIKNKGYTFINITGISVSFACCILIGLYVQDELSYDRYHPNAERIYRLANHMAGASFTNGIAKVCEPWGPEARRTIPEVADACRFVFYGQTLVGKGEERYYESGGLYADSTLFNIFGWDLLKGNPETALSEPYSLVLTEQMAEKYFPGRNPLGETLTFDNKHEMQVTGVIEDIPSNSHFTFRFLVSFDTYIPPDQGDIWTRWLQYYTYLLLQPDADPQVVESKLDDMLAAHLDEETSEAWTPFLQPVTDIHLESKLHREMSVNSDRSYIYIFSIIALLILIIAITNFVNLYTARATQRAREVGIRKVVGANRRSLIQQFIIESMMVTVFAAVLAIILAKAMAPPLNALLGKALVLNFAANGPLTFSLIVLTLLTGIISGSYPAFVLSSYQPINVLKADSGSTLLNRSGGRQALLRKGLVVFQFSIATFLIIAALVVSGQLNYIQSKNLGFNQEQVINIPMSSPETIRKSEIFKQELLQVPGVVTVSVSANRPGGSDFGVSYVAPGLPDDQLPPMRCLVVDEDFLETYQMEIAEGRDFSREIPTDSSAYLLNETAARQLGWENAVGQRLAMPAIDREPAPVIGVVRDFHFRSLHEPIRPLFFFIEKNWFTQFNVRLDAARVNETLTLLEKKWETIEPDHPLRYTFFDQSFGALHDAERTTARLIRWFTLLAVFITCLGLLGLSAYTLERRTKEVGIRKVFGASVVDILVLLSKEVLILVSLAVLIAAPLAWLATSNWLENFAYNINPGIGFFLAAALLAFGIALLTISYHAMQSALRNPVNSLRYE